MDDLARAGVQQWLEGGTQVDGSLRFSGQGTATAEGLRRYRGDALLLMTDGVLEAESAAGQPFDVEGVEAVYQDAGGVIANEVPPAFWR